MPHYVFLCNDCHKQLTEVLRVAELPTYEAMCPHCGSRQVEQRVAAVTSKKS